MENKAKNIWGKNLREFNSYMRLDSIIVKSMIEFANECEKDVLTDFLDFLLKEGYCDSDVYSEPPTAIDQYLIFNKNENT